MGKKKSRVNALFFWTLLFFLTTLPFYTFHLQVHVYGVLMALNAALCCFFLDFLQNKTPKTGTLVVFIGAMSIYAVPSNMMSVAGLAVIPFCFFVKNWYQK